MVKVQSFEPGDEVYVLNLRSFQGRCPKWIRRYRDVAVVVQKINNVTYKVKCDQWKKSKVRIVHVDKLKSKAKSQLPDVSDDVVPSGDSEVTSTQAGN